VSPVPTGTDDGGDVEAVDLEHVAYVLAAVEGGCSTRSEIVDAVCRELQIDLVNRQPIESAIEDALERGLILEDDKQISLTADGIATIEEIAARIDAEIIEPAIDTTDDTNTDTKNTQPPEIEHLRAIGWAIADYFGFSDRPKPSTAWANMVNGVNAEEQVDGLICGLDGDSVEFGSDDGLGDGWGRAYQVGQWLRSATDTATLLGLGLVQNFAPRIALEHTRERWDAHAEAIERPDLRLPEGLEPTRAALSFAVGFFSQWIDMSAAFLEAGEADPPEWVSQAREFIDKARALASELDVETVAEHVEQSEPVEAADQPKPKGGKKKRSGKKPPPKKSATKKKAGRKARSEARATA
jgi:hypothetical protein